MKLDKIWLRVQQAAPEDGDFSTVWLISGKLGAQCLMNGALPGSMADALACEMERLGIEVEREICPHHCAGEPRPSTGAMEQQMLFKQDQR